MLFILSLSWLMLDSWLNASNKIRSLFFFLHCWFALWKWIRSFTYFRIGIKGAFALFLFWNDIKRLPQSVGVKSIYDSRTYRTKSLGPISFWPMCQRFEAPHLLLATDSIAFLFTFSSDSRLKWKTTWNSILFVFRFSFVFNCDDFLLLMRK